MSKHYFERDGYEHVLYPNDLHAAVEKAADSWRRFCALDEALKSQVPYIKRGQLGVGYEHKVEKGKGRDEKEDLQFMRAMRGEFEKVAHDLGIEPLQELLSDADALVDMLGDSLSAFARELEDCFSLAGLEQEILRGRDEWMIRFLNYFADRDYGDEIASAHADKSGITAHLHESDHGFEYLDRKLRWQGLSFSRGSMMILPGMQMQYRSKGEIKALWHRVVATQKSARKGRQSIVCFVPLVETPVSDKSKIGRLQDMDPGFNYDMPFLKFSEFFIA